MALLNFESKMFNRDRSRIVASSRLWWKWSSQIQTTLTPFKRLSFLKIVVILLTLLLSGCADYQLGLNFYSETSGEIVQHLHLNDRLTTLTPIVADQWFAQLEAKAKRLQGSSQRLSLQELEVHIPFSSGADLEQKFNQLFQAVEMPDGGDQGPAPEIVAQVNLIQQSRWFLLRNHLQLELDLRPIGLLIAQGKSLVNVDGVFDLEFYLNTPWDLGKANIHGSVPAQVHGNQVIWSLRPGQINYLEATFWVPSPVGMGSVVILVGTIVAIWFRQKRIVVSATHG